MSKNKLKLNLFVIYKCTFGVSNIFGLILIISTVFNMNNKNVNWAVNYHIRLIPERSCDTEDWSNDDENTDFTSQDYISL